MEHWGLDGGSPAIVGDGGVIVTSDGRSYTRTPERVKRANGHAAIDDGAPVATNVYPDGMYVFEGDAAELAWQVILPRLIVGKPPPVRDLQWVGHVWVAEDGSPLLYFDGCH